MHISVQNSIPKIYRQQQLEIPKRLNAEHMKIQLSKMLLDFNSLMASKQVHPLH
jgi:hypothetical protein